MFRDPSYGARSPSTSRRCCDVRLAEGLGRRLHTAREVLPLAILLDEAGAPLDRARCSTRPTSTRVAARRGGRRVRARPCQVHAQLPAGGRHALARRRYYTAAYGGIALDRRLRARSRSPTTVSRPIQVFAEVHLVSCRNVLIYFDREASGPRAGAVPRLAGAVWLPRAGLARGRCAMSRHADAFDEVSRDERIYQRSAMKPLDALRAHDPRIVAVGRSASAVKRSLELLPELPATLPAPILVVGARAARPEERCPRCSRPAAGCASPNRGQDRGRRRNGLLRRPATTCWSSATDASRCRATSWSTFAAVDRRALRVRRVRVRTAGARHRAVRRERRRAHGLALIRQRGGGLAWVQDPVTAQISYMPGRRDRGRQSGCGARAVGDGARARRLGSGRMSHLDAPEVGRARGRRRGGRTCGRASRLCSRSRDPHPPATSGTEALEGCLPRRGAGADRRHMPGIGGLELAELMRGSERTQRRSSSPPTPPSTPACSAATRPGAVDFVADRPQLLRSKSPCSSSCAGSACGSRRRSSTGSCCACRLRSACSDTTCNPLSTRSTSRARRCCASIPTTRPSRASADGSARRRSAWRALIAQLLDFATTRQGNLPVQPKDADLRVARRERACRVRAGSPAGLRHEGVGDPRGTWDPDRILQLLEPARQRPAARRSGRTDRAAYRSDATTTSCTSEIENGGVLPDNVRDDLFAPFVRPTRAAAARDSEAQSCTTSRAHTAAGRGGVGRGDRVPRRLAAAPSVHERSRGGRRARTAERGRPGRPRPRRAITRAGTAPRRDTLQRGERARSRRRSPVAPAGLLGARRPARPRSSTGSRSRSSSRARSRSAARACRAGGSRRRARSSVAGSRCSNSSASTRGTRNAITNKFHRPPARTSAGDGLRRLLAERRDVERVAASAVEPCRRHGDVAVLRRRVLRLDAEQRELPGCWSTTASARHTDARNAASSAT